MNQLTIKPFNYYESNQRYLSKTIFSESKSQIIIKKKKRERKQLLNCY